MCVTHEMKQQSQWALTIPYDPKFAAQTGPQVWLEILLVSVASSPFYQHRTWGACAMSWVRVMMEKQVGLQLAHQFFFFIYLF